MLRIPCPWCGERDETEFHFGGQSLIARPEETVDDRAWGDYLFFRDNPKGRHWERWQHSFGCGQWFNVLRDTLTHEIAATCAMSEPPPEPPP